MPWRRRQAHSVTCRLISRPFIHVWCTLFSSQSPAALKVLCTFHLKHAHFLEVTSLESLVAGHNFTDGQSRLRYSHSMVILTWHGATYQMSILSQLRNSELGLPHFVQGFFRDDRLYRYLNVYPLKGLCEGSLIHSNHRADRIPPVHRLSVELLAENFRHYVQNVDESQPSLSLCVRPFSQTTPFHLGQVCYYWRAIANLLSPWEISGSHYSSVHRGLNISLSLGCGCIVRRRTLFPSGSSSFIVPVIQSYKRPMKY